MSEKESYLKGKHILAVDDEADILETIEEILDESKVDTARDYNSASQKIKERKYDLAILDIMGVKGYVVLELCNKKLVIVVMLTAYDVSPEVFNSSYEIGAASCVPLE